MGAAPSLENKPSTQLIDVMILFEEFWDKKSRQIQLAIKLFQGIFLEKSLHIQEAQK